MITRAKTREFHDNESENISGESIEGAALIRGRRSLTFLSQMRCLFEGGAYSSKYMVLQSGSKNPNAFNYPIQIEIFM